MKYTITYAPEAKEGLAKLKANEPKCFDKAVKLLNELMEHPRTGTGKPKQLSGDRAGQWRRKISDKHRLVYEIQYLTRCASSQLYHILCVDVFLDGHR